MICVLQGNNDKESAHAATDLANVLLIVFGIERGLFAKLSINSLRKQ
jgi:hypothetical protein